MTRSSLEDFEFISRLKYASRVRYMTSHDPKDILGAGYFNNAGQFLESADEIDIVYDAESGYNKIVKV